MLPRNGAEPGVRHEITSRAAAGLYVVHGDPRRAAVEPRCTKSIVELVDAAIDVASAHAIKLTEACLHEDVAPDPGHHAAAQALAHALKD